MADLLDFLAPGDVPPDFDAPSRPLPANSGGYPPGISRMPARELRRIMLTTRDGLPNYQAVREVNRYPAGIQGNPGTVTVAQGDVLVINDTPTSRIFLSVRNRSDSAGILLVGIGQVATFATAAFELPAGGVLLFDYAVPQDEIHLAASGGTCNYVVSWNDSALL